MQLSYLSMTEKEMPDLDALLALDRAAWRKLDATQDVKVMEFILKNIGRDRLFFAPPFPTGELLRHIIVQLLAGSPIEALCEPTKLRQDLDFLLTGYLGRREELPIHPRVARHFGLTWWKPDMRYRWYSNRWTFEEVHAALHQVDPMASVTRSILVYSNCQGEELIKTGRQMPSLVGRVGFKWIPLHQVTPQDWPTRYGPDFMAGVEVLWEQVESGPPSEHRQELHGRLPSGCQVLRFPPYNALCLWPFAGNDPRIAADPTRYPWPDFDRRRPVDRGTLGRCVVRALHGNHHAAHAGPGAAVTLGCHTVAGGGCAVRYQVGALGRAAFP